MTQKGNSERFFLADEKHVRIDGTEVVLPDVLYFEFYRASREERGVPYELTAKATKEHVKEYATAFNRFKRSFPNYKLPWGEEVDFVGVKAQEPGTVVITEKLPELPELEEVVEVVAVEPGKLSELEEAIAALPESESEPEVDLVAESLPEVTDIVGNPNE